jgi:hypothetical protein
MKLGIGLGLMNKPEEGFIFASFLIALLGIDNRPFIFVFFPRVIIKDSHLYFHSKLSLLYQIIIFFQIISKP